MRLFRGIFIRATFIVVWFLIGYLTCDNVRTGFISSASAFLLMEFCYYIDKKTVGIDRIVKRLDYLDETIDEAHKTRTLIIHQIDIDMNSISDDSEYNKGVKAGMASAQTIVENRFDEVANQLLIKMSKT